LSEYRLSSMLSSISIFFFLRPQISSSKNLTDFFDSSAQFLKIIKKDKIKLKQNKWKIIIKWITGNRKQSIDFKLREIKRLGEVRFSGSQIGLELSAFDDLWFDLSSYLNVSFDFVIYLSIEFFIKKKHQILVVVIRIKNQSA
jgi:hypothetical protein